MSMFRKNVSLTAAGCAALEALRLGLDVEFGARTEFLRFDIIPTSRIREHDISCTFKVQCIRYHSHGNQKIETDVTVTRTDLGMWHGDHAHVIINKRDHFYMKWEVREMEYVAMVGPMTGIVDGQVTYARDHFNVGTGYALGERAKEVIPRRALKQYA